MGSTATTLRGRILDEVGNLLLQPPIGGFGKVLQHGPRNSRQIALTFDDGPNAPSTIDVLDVLGEHDVKATFFCVGVNAKRFPEIVKRAYDEGHIIGNHSMYHSRKSGLLFKDDDHISDCTTVLSGIIGVTPQLYRAPWGWLTPWETRRIYNQSYSPIGWDVYTYDWQVPSPPGEDIAEQVKRDVRPGSIVLFHDGIAGVHEASKPTTVKAVELTIKHFKKQGFEFVTIPQFTGSSAYLPS